MLAAQYVAGRGIEVAEVDAPPPGPGEVQLEVAYVGICGTDLHILVGHMDDRVPDHGVIGHEMSGRVAVVGEGVTGWSEGDPVTVMPLRWCGRCPTCVAGHAHICDRLDFVGIDSTGAMQQLWNVPHELLVPLPPDLPLRAAALVEPVAVAHHDVARAGLSAGERVLVVGGGPIGVLIAVVARARGAKALLVEPDPLPTLRRGGAGPRRTRLRRSGPAGLARHVVGRRRRGRDVRGVRHPGGPRSRGGRTRRPRPARGGRHPRGAAAGRHEAGLLEGAADRSARASTTAPTSRPRSSSWRRARSRWMHWSREPTRWRRRPRRSRGSPRAAG